MGAVLQPLKAIAKVVKDDDEGFWRSKGTMTKGQSEIKDHKYKQLGLGG
jgi:hypothetical protein